MFAFIYAMQLAFDAVDRLVELLEERSGVLTAAEAARHLLALEHVSDGLAQSLIGDLVAGDSRLTWRGRSVALAEPVADPPLEAAEFVVFDLETTGLAAASARICEIGAVRVRGLAVADSWQTLVAPRIPLPAPIGVLTGLRDDELRRAPRIESAIRRFTAFAGQAALVAHNARFDVAFLNRQLERLTGRRLSSPVLDTVSLSRNLLRDRIGRTSLAALAHFFGTSVEPCHRALPDAQATAEVLIALIGIAQERGARTLSDLQALSAPRARRVYGKRSLAQGAPSRPGVYLFRDRNGHVLYVGRARDLRARLRSYFRGERQRPAVEAALGAVERIEWRILGSELEAALEELRLIRELRPPANARRSQPERYVYLKRRGDEVAVSSLEAALGPIRSRRDAERAARALRGCSETELGMLIESGGPLPRLRGQMCDLSEALRYEDAARLRDRITALERVLAHLRRLERLRNAELCLVVPAVEPGWQQAFFLCAGRVSARRALPPGPGARLELEAGLAAARTAAADGVSHGREHCDELLVVSTFLRRPPPELKVFPLDADTIWAGLRRGYADARSAA